MPKRAGLHLIIDSSGLSIVGEGEWATAKHGRRGRRGWKKLHLGVDPTGVIVAHALTEATLDDATTGVELIAAVNDDITRDYRGRGLRHGRLLRYGQCAGRDRRGPAGQDGSRVPTRAAVKRS